MAALSVTTTYIFEGAEAPELHAIMFDPVVLQAGAYDRPLFGST